MVDAFTFTTMRPLAVPLAEYPCRLTQVMSEAACQGSQSYTPALGEVFRKLRGDASIARYGRCQGVYIIFVEVSRNIEKAMR